METRHIHPTQPHDNQEKRDSEHNRNDALEAGQFEEQRPKVKHQNVSAAPRGGEGFFAEMPVGHFNNSIQAARLGSKRRMP